MTIISTVPRNSPAPQLQGETATRTIPFDYLFNFDLEGEPNKTSRKTVAVSVGASFTAVSVGYGVVPEVSPVFFGIPVPRGGAPAVASKASLRNLNLGDMMDAIEAAIGNAPDVARGTPALEAALRNGIRLNSTFAHRVLAGNGNAVLDPAILDSIFQLVPPPVRDVQFLYSLFDEGTGREFQSDPILNVAGLGASDGKRPFRYFAQPITFSPRSTIRMEVTELEEFRGKLHVALHGYKVLSSESADADAQARRAGRRSR